MTLVENLKSSKAKSSMRQGFKYVLRATFRKKKSAFNHLKKSDENGENYRSKGNYMMCILLVTTIYIKYKQKNS